MALSGAAAYPRACQALSSMLSRNALNPADITIVSTLLFRYIRCTNASKNGFWKIGFVTTKMQSSDNYTVWKLDCQVVIYMYCPNFLTWVCQASSYSYLYIGYLNPVEVTIINTHLPGKITIVKVCHSGILLNTVKCFNFAGSNIHGFQNWTYLRGFKFAVSQFICTMT